MIEVPVSAALRRVAPSATIAVSAQARALAREGRDIINLGVGEPDADTPAHIRSAAIAAIEAGHTRYTDVDGLPQLKEAVCKKFSRDNGLAYAPSEINVSPGAKTVIYNALVATISAGDEVIIPAPYWVSYPDMVCLAGGSPVIVPTSTATGLKLDAAGLESAITERTRWLILNSPGNPTGACYSEEELRALADVLLRHPHVWILSDDIYEHLLFDGLRFFTIAQVEPRLRDRTLTVNGVSKGYAMTGWRIGFGGGPEGLIRQMAKVMGQSTTNACTIAQWAAIAALDGPQDFLAEQTVIFQRRRDLVFAALAEAPGISCDLPQGAFYLFPSCSGVLGKRRADGQLIQSDEDFVVQLLKHEGVAAVHGAAFGLSPHFRISYALDDATLEEACARIIGFCSRLQ
ncbi:pyridoxal phosphate-dependent aminotransferase [Qipengyuania sp. ASV99]|uniref:pyridoxal phosphate-dependent aminotransferase n=1 Tax=Qipengyuania sp. ASV99 TaxID=3399681 RepID=UPI003A4C7B59